MKRISVIAICATVILSLVGCQKGVKNPYLELSKNIIEVPAVGGDFSFDVSSNIQYAVNQTDEQATWLTMLDYTTNGEVITYNIRVDENTTEVERSSEVTFIGEGVTPKRLLVVQAAAVADPPIGPEETEDVEAGVLTEWDFKTLATSLPSADTWTAVDQGATVVGTFDKYVSATTGEGRIEYYSINKEGIQLYEGSDDDEKGYALRSFGGKYNRFDGILPCSRRLLVAYCKRC